MRKYFQDWQNYQERKDEEWYDLMDNFAKQINDNNAIDIRHKEEIKKALILIKGLIESKNKADNSSVISDRNQKFDPYIIPESLTGWLKFLFYDCPKYSFPRSHRRKFLCQLGKTIRLLISIIVIVLLFLLANDNYHLRYKVAELQRTEQKYKILQKASHMIKSEGKQAEKSFLIDENK